MVGYKVFVAKNGQLYPPMVANPDGAGTPVGVWLDADEGATAKNADGTDKTNTLGRLKVKAGGKGTAGGSGDLAYRPGWHLGEVPLAPQFYETDKITGEKVQHPNFVWAECEFAADVNYQEEAMSYGYTASGKFQHSLAGLPKIPVDGYYTYRTNPNPDTVPWYITGAMKVTKLLGDEETDSILNKMGVVPMKRAGGPIDLAKLGFTQTQFSDRDPEERTNREILADAFESGVARTTAEKTLISDYRGAIKSIDKAENDLREVNAKIKELSFAEGQRDNAKLAELHQKAGELQSKVTWWDKRLLTLEASAPLKAVLESEKKRVRKEWQQKGRERVEAYRQARNDTKTRQQLRAYIKHSVKRLDNMFRHPTDAAHIPAELRDAIADFMQPFLDEETTDAGNTSVFRAETLRAAREAYESLGEGENELSDVYDEDTAARLAELSKTMDGRRLAELSAVELSELKKVVQHFAHLASDGNKAFVAGKMESIGNLAEGVISAANERGRKESVKGTDNAFTRMLTTEMMTPSYFFKHIGGNMQTLYNDLLIGGQKTFSEDVQSSRAFLLETADKYHYWQWADTNEKNKNDKLAMTNSIGQKITLTRETALGLYATYMRELSGNDQNAKHLTAGGFVYSEIQENTGGKIARTYQDRTAHPMSAEDMKQVMNWLTAEQKSFANEMVSYLSTTVAGWGNRTSEKLNGYDKFEEPYYYPYKVSTDFLRTNLANMDNRAAMIKNMGMTKSTVRKANAPVDAIPFMQVWTNHVSNMILYDSFALAQDNFMRVFNTKTGVDKDGQTASVSVKAALTEAYGKEAASYILNLMKQIYGGITIDPTADVANKLNSWMKKNAVVASASVVVQQPSAIGRAMALVDPKYFAKTITAKRNYEEAVKYSGTAAIKRMGRFDTSTGRNTAKWLMTPPNEKTLAGKARAFMTFGKYDTGYRDDVLSLGATKADEVTWAHIWNAVKMELQYTTDLEPGSEEFLLAAGRRFDEVINYTQVYDSVLSKSAIMRSEQGLVRMATNFMAEPILSYNMLFDAGAQAKAGNKGYAGRAAAAWALSVALNSLLKSIVTAMRDDDEDKTYIEKYIASLAGNFADDINPLGLIPYVRDALSIFMGYDVERTDMSLISDLYDAMGKMDNENKTMSEKIEIMSGAIAALFGVPLKNVLRDVRSVYNLFFETAPLSETTGEGIRQSVYDALGMEDPAISGAAKLYAAGDIDAYEKAVERLTAGGMDPEEAERRLKKAAGITQSNSVYLDNCIYGYADLNMAVSGGDGDSVKQIVSAMVKAYEGGGKTEKEAKAAIRSTLTSEWKPKYLDADSMRRSEIRKALGATGIYASADFDGWIKN